MSLSQVFLLSTSNNTLGMILCLDPSLRAFGWALIDNDDIVSCGCITTKPVLSDEAAIKIIALGLKKLLDLKPSKVLSEIAVGSKSSRANQSLSYVKALVVTACAFQNIEVEFVKAKDVKRALTNNLDAEKDEILEKVREKFQSFDRNTLLWPKFKVYAASDAAALYLAKKE